jgi:hypothetical protein
MLMLEIILLVGLLGVMTFLLIRLDAQQRQLQNLRDQLEHHIRRGHPAATPVPTPPPVTLAPALGRRGRPALRLIKE